jgi:aminoglycoside phosphotransferase (APT) family kinase protein
MPMIEIEAALVKELIRTQFPRWAELPIVPVGNGGWDNRTFQPPMAAIWRHSMQLFRFRMLA